MTVNSTIATALPIAPNRNNLTRRESRFSGEKAASAKTMMSVKNGARKSATKSTACWPRCTCFLNQIQV